jgi:putative FmdB family regulatory protein
MGAMPVYEFRCPDCDHEFEKLLPLGKIASCPKCGREKTNLRISGFHVSRRRIFPIPELTQPAMPKRAISHAASGGMYLKDVRITNAHIGMSIGSAGEVRSEGLQIDNCDIGIDNAGKFDGSDTIIR